MCSHDAGAHSIFGGKDLSNVPCGKMLEEGSWAILGTSLTSFSISYPHTYQKKTVTMADTLSSSAPSSTKTEFVATCHCRRVRVKFWADPNRLVAWDCDCSDCKMRQNVHLVVPKDCFQVDMDETLEDVTTLYQWGTKTAIRRFCKTCGEFWLE